MRGSRRILAAAAIAAAFCAPAAVAALVVATRPTTTPTPLARDEPGVHAAFAHRSYAPGQLALLVVTSPAPRVTVSLFRIGKATPHLHRDDVLQGAPVSRPVVARMAGRARGYVRVHIGAWPSGLYFARLTSPGGKIGFAPFVLRPRRLGESRVAVVIPTSTWQAYNFRDADRDGVGDTWYASGNVHSVDLTRPFLNRGVPPHFRSYDAGFFHWLDTRGHRADFLSDDDFERIANGDRLARLYDLVVFPGHTEYVTTHEYDVIERYRNLGGNLAFLSANNFFRRVVRHGDRIERTERWRELGRPEAGLIGSQYLDWNGFKYPNRPYLVVGAQRAPWLFRGTRLRNGDRFGRYGIEIDARTASSPPGTAVLATIQNIFGHGRSAEMTYYTNAAGAKVFAAGVMNFGGSAWFQPAARMLDNLWARLTRP